MERQRGPYCAQAAEIAATWRLELGAMLAGADRSCVVVEATAPDGSPAILKIGTGTDREVIALEAWRGGGAPRLLGYDRTRHALLLERVIPGSHPDGAPGTAVARLLQALHVAPPGGLQSLEDVVRRRLDRAASDGHAPLQKVAWARAKLAALENDSPQPVLLHGGFDERNIVVCERRGLCAIDASAACAGDPAYDAGFWVHGNRRPGRRARLDEIVAATGLPRDRVRDWAAVIGVHQVAPPRSAAGV